MEKPKFVLDGADPQAPGSVRYWAQRVERRIERGTLPKGMASEAKAARAIADEMDEYQKEKRAKEREAEAKVERQGARGAKKKATRRKKADASEEATA